MKRIIAIAFLLAGTVLIGQSVSDLLTQADQLHEDNNYDQVFTVLKQAESMEPDNFEVIWRLARAHFDLSDNTTDEEAISKNVYAGFDYAKRALEMNPDRAESHKWYGILIGRVGELEGTEQKIKNSYLVAEHTLKAIELDPTDDGNYHVMGRWNYTLADLSWIERTVAGLVYAEPPEASFEDARDFFQKAINIDPTAIRNYVWLGKTYEELDDDDAAATAYKKALSLPADTDSDRILQDEARDLLEDL
ncbi:MAG: tetratricopeptide repeat protein [Fidelibacterota bacterium]